MRSIYFPLLGLILSSTNIWLINSAAAQTPIPSATKPPASIEQMFEEELNTVRGEKNATQTEREHTALMEALIERLETGDVNKKYEAALLLEREAIKSDIPVLTAALKAHDAAPDIQHPLIRALGATKDPTAIEILRYHFNSGNTEVQLAVIDALANMPDEIVINMLADILTTGDNERVHVRAASALGKIGGDKALYVLRGVVQRLRSPAAKYAALWAIRYAQDEIPQQRIDVDFDEGRQQNYYYKGMIYYVYRPAFRKDAKKDTWLIVCIHNSNLNYEEVIDVCQPIAKQYKTTLIVPFFDPINFPEFTTFNLHGIRADKRLFEIMDLVGSKAEVKTREMYLIGFGNGGDFAQRLAFFYPDRIARAAFTSTFFYPFEVDQYFPEGLKTTPLAPDLKVDFVRVTKTDFSFILDPYQGGRKDLNRLNQTLVDYTSKSQHATRIRFRNLTEATNNAVGIAQSGKKFLFPPIQ